MQFPYENENIECLAYDNHKEENQTKGENRLNVFSGCIFAAWRAQNIDSSSVHIFEVYANHVVTDNKATGLWAGT